MKRKSCARGDDDVRAMLNSLDYDIHCHPGILRLVSAEFISRLQSLVGNVEIDLDQPLHPVLDEH